jgi:hypothetical protein
MPTASEVVPNKALSAKEVKELLHSDFIRLMENLSLLSSPVAFGKVSWKISLTLSTENDQTHQIDLISQPVARNILTGDLGGIPAAPQLAAVKQHPLAGAFAESVSRELERNVTSPNAERLREGMPVPVDVKDRDGTKRQEQVQYAPDREMPEDVRIK